MRQLSDNDIIIHANDADVLSGDDGKCDMIRYVVDCYDDVSQNASADMVVIKDAWPPAEQPVESDSRSEIVLLHRICNEFEHDPPSHLYPRFEIGGHMRLDIDGRPTIDTTDAIFDLMGTS
ncbi:hypothetical protein H4R20_005846 [Coemansia guatemalensis]|uniref:Uncharacterized protein n=1 Tax=Coemansia guatemalensis TaxID=2761395 RepID=A0A9W8LP85_9FUNG|nr:hypothetical protein H4R20_005846 [Coemansia guatemalensis]